MNSVPVNVDMNSVPVNVDVNSVPVNEDVNSVPVNVDVNSVPVNVDMNSVPVNEDVNSVPVNVDVNRVPVNVDMNSVPVNVDVNRVPVNVDVNRVPVNVDVNRVPVTPALRPVVPGNMSPPDTSNGSGPAEGAELRSQLNRSAGWQPPGFLSDATEHPGVQAALITAYCLVIALGLLGNALVLCVILRYRAMRTVTNLFIANLALADLLAGALCLPFTLAYTLLGEWRFGAALCHALPFGQALSVHVSVLTMSVIALDRYRCVVFHLGRRLTWRRSVLVTALTWTAGAVLAAPLAVFREYRLEEFPSVGLRVAVCSEKWPPGAGRGGAAYSLAMLLLQYVLPLAVISYAYVCIWVKLNNHVSPAGRGAAARRRRSTTRMLALSVLVFAGCWLPFHALQLASDLDLALRLPEYKLLFTLLHVGAMASTCSNPLLYGWMNRNYRTGFLMALRCHDQPDALHPDGSFRTRSTRRRPAGPGPTAV
ncbi:Neuropeptide Y receptor type 2 [Liparis tanakae]|uniref:Neuropeptide Y receptor type 2 n=1 Tax=Liparis tanakae TaxID=230148 RepID=A0A4Z2E5J5_9TELE|nr:Neuropeptide Y receptor type 2 [Liparis tanakae]